MLPFTYGSKLSTITVVPKTHKNIIILDRVRSTQIISDVEKQLGGTIRVNFENNDFKIRNDTINRIRNNIRNEIRNFE